MSDDGLFTPSDWLRLMGRRTLLLVAALLLAALGTSLVFVYVGNVDARAREGQTPVEVWVATKEITDRVRPLPKPTATDHSPPKYSPTRPPCDGALGDLTPIADKVALSTIYPGEQLIEASSARKGRPRPSAIPPGNFAVAFEFADPNRVANFVAPGQQVAVLSPCRAKEPPYLLGKISPSSCFPLSLSSPSATSHRTGRRPSRRGGAHPPFDACPRRERVEATLPAQGKGELYLALREPNPRARPTDPTTGENLFPATP